MYEYQFSPTARQKLRKLAKRSPELARMIMRKIIWWPRTPSKSPTSRSRAAISTACIAGHIASPISLTKTRSESSLTISPSTIRLMTGSTNCSQWITARPPAKSVIARSVATKQSRLAYSEDCFASLAMTPLCVKCKTSGGDLMSSYASGL
jgi:hypothetical protein